MMRSVLLVSLVALSCVALGSAVSLESEAEVAVAAAPIEWITPTFLVELDSEIEAVADAGVDMEAEAEAEAGADAELGAEAEVDAEAETEAETEAEVEGPACQSAGGFGKCIPQASCAGNTVTIYRGLCPGTSICCVPRQTVPSGYARVPKPSDFDGSAVPFPSYVPSPSAYVPSPSAYVPSAVPRPTAPVAPVQPAAPVRGAKGGLVRGAPLALSEAGPSYNFPKIASQPQADWIVGWGAQSQIRNLVAQWQGKTGVLVAYNIPGRDCGSYSAGGAADEAQYTQWIQDFAAGVGYAKAIVILEPDTIPQSAPGQACASKRESRVRMLQSAIRVLKASCPNVSVYVDVGHPRWLSVYQVADVLKQIGMSQADGFAINVANTVSTTESITWGRQISKLVQGAPHFVIDTSRNGGQWSSEWCNSPVARLGHSPTTSTGDALADAFLWVKRPGESDGNCRGNPIAGQFSEALARQLSQ